MKIGTDGAPGILFSNCTLCVEELPGVPELRGEDLRQRVGEGDLQL